MSFEHLPPIRDPRKLDADSDITEWGSHNLDITKTSALDEIRRIINKMHPGPDKNFQLTEEDLLPLPIYEHSAVRSDFEELREEIIK
jgi:hypothetical protein